jgi:phosphoribosylformylglycinamidine synthase
MMNGMEGSCLGVWVAHGEGRFTFENEGILQSLRDQALIPLTYADDQGLPTET